MKIGVVFSTSFLVFFYIKILHATKYCSGVNLNEISITPNCARGGSTTTSCIDPIMEGTIARLSCAPGYKKKKDVATDTILCNHGHWDYDVPECEPICGICDPNIETIPWHALIYVESDQQKYLKCGGIIISIRLVITAAHCAWDGKLKIMLNESSLWVNALKTDDDYAYQNVREIHIPQRFKIASPTQEGDIAILVVSFFQYSPYVAPICIEPINENNEFSGKRFEGFIPTNWEKNGKSLLNYSHCEGITNINNENMYKLSCKQSFYGERIYSRDIGSGLVVKKVINGVESYFLRGIVTNATTGPSICPTTYSVTVTNTHKYFDIILNLTSKYSVKEFDDAQRRNSLLTTCEIPFISNLIAVLEEFDGINKTLTFGDKVPFLNKVNYSCEKNYRLLGTSTNFCSLFKWAENHPICIEISRKTTVKQPTGSCDAPKIPNLMTFVKHLDATLEKEITGSFVESSTFVKYKCKKNYHLIGKTENQCFHSKWEYEHPTCISIHEELPVEDSCEVPYLPNSIIFLEGSIRKNISVGNYAENAKSISYNCIGGYLLHGATSNFCNEGNWLLNHPSCVKLSIRSPTKEDCEVVPLLNGHIDLNTAIKENELAPIYVRHDEFIRYKCKTKYLLEGSVSNICQSGDWRNVPPKCLLITPNDCAVPSISNAIITLEGEILKNVSFGNYVENFNLITYSCKKNYVLEGRKTNYCHKGKWIDEHPKCIKYCPSDTLRGVTFSAICEFNGVRISCDRQYLKVGTIAKLFCQHGYKKPDRLLQETLLCEESGNWDYNPFRCEPLCGTEESDTVPYIKGGEKANITAVPWHAAIFLSSKGTYSQICGGSIISPKLVISGTLLSLQITSHSKKISSEAAHCFWQGPDLIVQHSNVVVGVGKYYRDYFIEEPLTPQFFNVSEIHIPEGFQGPLQAYHDDLAILVINGYIEFNSYIKPICIQRLDEEGKTIQSGLLGRVAGWGKIRTDLPSEELKMLEISTLSYTDCLKAAEVRFRHQIAADKFCISSPDGESVCPGDSGGGFVIPKVINEEKTFFLWGIVSNGLTDKNNCESVNLTSLTNIQHYYDKILYYEKKFGVK